MTDNEIVKALECCILGDCQGCFYGDTDQRHCKDDLMQNALDLINRLQAENERLRAECENQSVLWRNNFESIFESAKETIKEEVIKEFWSRLQGVAYQSEREWSHGEHPMLIELDDAKEIYEEMVGDV